MQKISSNGVNLSLREQNPDNLNFKKRLCSGGSGLYKMIGKVVGVYSGGDSNHSIGVSLRIGRTAPGKLECGTGTKVRDSKVTVA